jgi:ATP-dependent helicase/nuclease subunit B
MYNLKVQERKIYEVHPVDLGVLYHEVLDAFSKKVAIEDKRWGDLTREDITLLVDEAVAALVSDPEGVLNSSARNRFVLQKVKRICTTSLWALCEHIKRGGFTPAGMEIDFSPDSSVVMPQVQLEDGQRLLLTGRIDRVDVMRMEDSDYIKIIDYKSGRKRFDLSEVELGTQLQLILSLNALLKNTPRFLNPKPGGLYYFHLDDPVLASDKPLDGASREAMLLECFKMSGLTLTDAAEAMDGKLTETGKSPVIPVTLNKDGSWSKSSAVADLEFFERLGGLVEDKIKELGTQMIQGIITPKPIKKGKHDACAYCRYDVICAYSVTK